MPSSIINSDNGLASGTTGLKTTGGDNGVLVFQSSGTETVRITSSGSIAAVNGWGGTNSSAERLGGIPIAFACERNGAGTIGGVLSFGNGATTGKGIRMPFAGKLIVATLSGFTVTGTITLDAYLNGVTNASYSLTATGSGGDVGVTQNFQASPLSFAAGDILGWYQTAVPSSANAYDVTFYVLFN